MARKDAHPMDPRDLIAESYRIEGIGVEDCRAIFFDWALGLDASVNPADAAKSLLDHHAPPEDHPMTGLLRDAAEGTPRPRRRRGRKLS
ncbi:MAG: hypothetical protein AAF501_04900 [Pseudomonadota bacterium]